MTHRKLPARDLRQPLVCCRLQRRCIRKGHRKPGWQPDREGVGGTSGFPRRDLPEFEIRSRNSVLSKRALRVAIATAAATTTLFLTGCTQEELSSAILMPLPASSIGVTNHTDRITDLWNISWAVLWGVGALAWGQIGRAHV